MKEGHTQEGRAVDHLGAAGMFKKNLVAKLSSGEQLFCSRDTVLLASNIDPITGGWPHGMST